MHSIHSFIKYGPQFMCKQIKKKTFADADSPH